MQYRGQQVEVIERGTKIGEYRRCQVAVDGVPCITFDVHEADFTAFANDRLRNEFLARQGASLIDQFGDARHPRQVATQPQDRLPA